MPLFWHTLGHVFLYHIWWVKQYLLIQQASKITQLLLSVSHSRDMSTFRVSGMRYSTIDLPYPTERSELIHVVSNSPRLSPVARLHQCRYHDGDVHPQAAAKTLPGECSWRQRRHATRLQTRGGHWWPREQRRAGVPIRVCEFSVRGGSVPRLVACAVWCRQNFENGTHQVGFALVR